MPQCFQKGAPRSWRRPGAAEGLQQCTRCLGGGTQAKQGQRAAFLNWPGGLFDAAEKRGELHEVCSWSAQGLHIVCSMTAQGSHRVLRGLLKLRSLSCRQPAGGPQGKGDVLSKPLCAASVVDWLIIGSSGQWIRKTTHRCSKSSLDFWICFCESFVWL